MILFGPDSGVAGPYLANGDFHHFPRDIPHDTAQCYREELIAMELPAEYQVTEQAFGEDTYPASMWSVGAVMDFACVPQSKMQLAAGICLVVVEECARQHDAHMADLSALVVHVSTTVRKLNVICDAIYHSDPDYRPYLMHVFLLLCDGYGWKLPLSQHRDLMFHCRHEDATALNVSIMFSMIHKHGTPMHGDTLLAASAA